MFTSARAQTRIDLSVMSDERERKGGRFAANVKREEREFVVFGLIRGYAVYTAILLSGKCE